MKKLLVVVIALVVVLAAVDVGSRIVMQRQLQERVDSYQAGAHAHVTIHGFPWLPKLAVDGRVAKITARAGPVGQGLFELDRVDVTVTGVRIHRSVLLHQRKLEIVAIEGGTVKADMTEAELTKLFGVPVKLGAGTVGVTVAGAALSGQISISNGSLRLDAPGFPVSAPIPTLPVLPCLADVSVIPGHLVGSCTFHAIPAVLKLALQVHLQ